jgi:PIN domain nuclease of toxin-antitoxin system
VSEIVLDASALMAVLREEPGAAAVEAVLDRAAVSAVNLSEVQAKLVERGTPAAIAWSWLVDLDLEVVDFDASQARVAGNLRPLTRARGLSLADRACLALAYVRGVAALTADRAWSGLEIGIEIRAIR